MRPDPLALPGVVGWWDLAAAADAPLSDRSGFGHDLEALGGSPAGAIRCR